MTSRRLLFLSFSMMSIMLFISPAWAQSQTVESEESRVLNSESELPTHDSQLKTQNSQLKTQNSRPFYQGRKQGWYWYRKEPVKAKKERPEISRRRKLPDFRDYTMRQLWDMYPDDFQKLLNTLMKKAVQKPTEENILDYLTMQDIARRKSLAYASVMSYVEQKHPELSTKTIYPITAPGQAAVVAMRVREQDQTIEGGRDRFALIMFTREGCDFCKAQKSILAYFVNKYGWPVRMVDIEENSNMAARFNVRMTPTIILVDRKSGDYMPISVGVISMSELGLKLYRTIRYLRGEITPQQWFMHDFERGKSNDTLEYTKNYVPRNSQ